MVVLLVVVVVVFGAVIVVACFARRPNDKAFDGALGLVVVQQAPVSHITAAQHKGKLESQSENVCAARSRTQTRREIFTRASSNQANEDEWRLGWLAVGRWLVVVR